MTYGHMNDVPHPLTTASLQHYAYDGAVGLRRWSRSPFVGESVRRRTFAWARTADSRGASLRRLPIWPEGAARSFRRRIFHAWQDMGREVPCSANAVLRAS